MTRKVKIYGAYGVKYVEAVERTLVCSQCVNRKSNSLGFSGYGNPEHMCDSKPLVSPLGRVLNRDCPRFQWRS